MERTTTKKIEDLLNSQKLLSEQAELMREWVKHQRSYRKEGRMLEDLYTINEFAIFLKKGFVDAKLCDLDAYLKHKAESKESITGHRILDVSEKSVKVYRYRINGFYRWILKQGRFQVDNELTYPKLKVVTKVEKSREELCEMRLRALLTNEIICQTMNGQNTQAETKQGYLLDDNNLNILRDFHGYKVTSGKVESYTGFVGKMCFLKRLGLHLKNKNRTYKDATREDIQEFLDLVQQGIRQKKATNGNSNDKIKINSTYKAHLLDFYRYIYGYFEEEQPRKYPEIVAWLYQKRKKSHDKIPKEIIPRSETKAMIEAGSDIRDKALTAILDDSSARVGELVNTNLKDLKINEVNIEGAKYKHLIATVTLRGKTGERTNQLFYSVPYLRLYLANHPLKDNPNAPLFVAMKENRYGQRLTAVGINKILQRSARKAGIKRHIHAHLFRHTNLTRMAKILSESELKIHAGWGQESRMATVYVHLAEKDVAEKILEKYGIVPEKKDEKESTLDIQICPNTLCSYQNIAEAKFCLKCGYPLTLDTAVSLNQIKEKEQELHNALLNKSLQDVKIDQATDMKEVLFNILKKDPELIWKLKEIIGLVEKLK